MIPEGFDYAAPKTLEEALALLAEDDTKPLAGAISDPDQVESKVEEGSLVADIEGVEAFPCEL